MSDIISFGDVSIEADGLDPAQVAAILDKRTRAAAIPIVHRAPGLAVLVCRIGDERFAVPLIAIAGIVPAARPTPVPGAPPALRGLIVDRGLVYNLIDPAEVLGVPSDEPGHILLLRGPVPRIALAVAEALGTDEVADEVADEVPTDDLTATRMAADGGRMGLIAVPRLIQALGIRRGGD